MQQKLGESIFQKYLDILTHNALVNKKHPKRRTIEKGEYSWNQGDICLDVKMYNNGVLQGKLVFKNSNSNRVQYEGSLVESSHLTLNGEGTLTIFHNGSVYFRLFCKQWVNNAPNGYCEIENSLDNTKYEGLVRNSKKTGSGKLTYVSKNTSLEGVWEDGVLRGIVDINSAGKVRKAVYQKNKFIRYEDNAV